MPPKKKKFKVLNVYLFKVFSTSWIFNKIIWSFIRDHLIDWSGTKIILGLTFITKSQYHSAHSGHKDNGCCIAYRWHQLLLLQAFKKWQGAFQFSVLPTSSCPHKNHFYAHKLTSMVLSTHSWDFFTGCMATMLGQPYHVVFWQPVVMYTSDSSTVYYNKTVK
jgi:hypothetical protein